MRLLNAKTHELVEFFDSEVPAYAILSHTWTRDEVLYSHMVEKTYQNRQGWKKVQGFCVMAESYRFEWVWVDTCCIDKSSSAELQEAINSMFQWYAEARTCYVYLADVSQPYSEDCNLKSSRWFTRGWPLQELIAPAEVVFFDADWQMIGTKATMAQELSVITSIHQSVLLDQRQYRNRCVAEKMSWFGDRATTRQEDVAYCLMGLFDVTMPLLYGEREKAFHRLQLKIMETTHDQSILVWTNHDGSSPSSRVLAQHPNLFKRCGPTRRSKTVPDLGVNVSIRSLQHRAYEMTNAGLRVHLMMFSQPFHLDCYFAMLECVTEDELIYGIMLRKQAETWGRFRAHHDFLCKPSSDGKLQVIERKDGHDSNHYFSCDVQERLLVIRDYVVELPFSFQFPGTLPTRRPFSQYHWVRIPKHLCRAHQVILGDRPCPPDVQWTASGKIILPEDLTSRSWHHPRVVMVMEHLCSCGQGKHTFPFVLIFNLPWLPLSTPKLPEMYSISMSNLNKMSPADLSLYRPECASEAGKGDRLDLPCGMTVSLHPRRTGIRNRFTSKAHVYALDVRLSKKPSENTALEDDVSNVKSKSSSNHGIAKLEV